MIAVLLLSASLASRAFAQQQTPVTFTEDFQSYGKSKKPKGWIDGRVGDLKAKPRGYFKTAFDPLGDKKGPNVVFGTYKSTGDSEDEKHDKRIGWFSTYVDKTFSAAGRHEFQGRMIEMSDKARVGLVVLSGYPEKDRYYLIASTKNAQNKLTMKLTAFGAGTPTGALDSNVVIETAKWYRFRIAADEVNNTTVIRARFWLDGATEPTTYQIEATDSSGNRLKTGHLGMWAGGNKDKDDGDDEDDDLKTISPSSSLSPASSTSGRRRGTGGGSGGGNNDDDHDGDDDDDDEDEQEHKKGVYIDGLSARSPSDTTAPLISFYESNIKLDPATTPAFKRDASIEIRITDDLSTFTSTATLDGNPYVSLTPVSVQGLHTLVVRAVDAPGNAREATLKFLVDKTAPVITLFANGTPLVTNAIFGVDVTLSATVQDISPYTTAATFNGAPITLPLPVAAEQAHQISVTATDAATNFATASATFTIDKTAPVITILANGADLTNGKSFRDDITLTWTVADLTLNQVTALLDGVTASSGAIVTVEGPHRLVITATDKANHTKSETRDFFLSKSAPEVTLLANGVAFVPDKTYNSAVHFTLQVRDPTPTTKVITVDDSAYTEGTPVTGDGLHNVKVVVTNVAGLWTTLGPSNFSIDTALPTITMTESGQPFQDDMKFTRDVLPMVTATDTQTANPKIVVILDGHPYPTNTVITEEKAEHIISATATDDGGNTASVGPFRFVLDKTPPVVTIVDAATGLPFAADSITNQPVRVKVTVLDITATTAVATLNGTSFDLQSPTSLPNGELVYMPAPIAAEGAYTLSVVATDVVSLSNAPATAAFEIDTTPPTLAFTDPVPDSTVGTLTITVGGTFDDAQTITIAGRDAALNQASKTFTIGDVALLEGPNAIAAVATDRAGNRSTPTLVVSLDTRSPELAITAPPANVCLDTTSLEVRGTVSDPRLEKVTVTVGSAAPVLATVDPATGAWTATVPVDEGKKLITVEAIDLDAHAVSLSRQVVIDRTAPVIEIRSGGEVFTASAINRAVAFLIRAVDADPNVVVTAKLDNNPYAQGTSIATEGQHTLLVTATDCAGHNSSRSIEFTIDLTAPTIRNLNPANAATAGTMPSTISGATDTDAVSVEISGTALRATPAADGTFTINAVPFAEGSNRFNLVATDRAGNSSSLDYAVTVRTVAPVVEIRESGLPISPGALFNRGVTPVIRSVDLQATIAATLNGNTFTPGTTISSDGDYVLRATATDSLGHTGNAEATFKIDRTPPVVKITTPAPGLIQSDHVQVRGTAGDAVSATVNGQPVTLAADGSFVVDSLLLEIGDNTIHATARDLAGNSGRDEILVTRDDLGAGLLLTYPPDRSITNRPATDVVGRLITAGKASVVTIGATSVAVDPTGGFRASGYVLNEGPNTITASVIGANGIQTSASTNVTADFTPPALAILESAQPLTDGARFAERAVISLQASDFGGGAVTTELTIDGTKITATSFTVTAAGGHSITAVARDLAGNESRSELTFFIGAATGVAQCMLEGFDPADGSVILSNKTEVVGRSGGAIGVKVNGVAALVADGAFCATVELPAEGPNVVNIVCTDVAGNATGSGATIMLRRVTGDPSISIDTPAEGFRSAQESIAVTGTVGAGVITADVNGLAATITGSDTNVPRPFSVAAVRLGGGLNTLVAHGRNAGGRVATASRRGFYLKNAPSINVTSPSSDTTTGVPRINVSGTYANLDPTTIVVSNLTSPGQTQAQFVRFSDTTGSFGAVDVPLGAGIQTLRISGRDGLNREASANVVVRLLAGTPSIVISQPLDQSTFGGGSDNVTVTGTFQAAAGSVVDVNGVTATVTGSTYTAQATFSTLAGGMTPVVARVTEPTGPSASATVIVTQVTVAPSVSESFPAPNASEVDSGAMMLVLFTQPMDGATITGAFRLEDSAGAPMSGTMHLDKDVLTFAPAALMTTGSQYTLRVSTAAKNLAGTALASEYSAPFTVATTAPSTAPTLTPLGYAVCGQSITVNGTATPGARVRLESGALTINGAADATGKFTFTYPISGQSGYAVVRVRTVGSDGSVSPAAELKVRIDCSGPQVLNAQYDRTVNKLTIQFSEPIDAATATVGVGNAILLTLDDGRAVGGSATVAQSIVEVTPAENLSTKSVSLTVTTAIKDKIGNRLAALFTQTFTLGGEQPVAGDGSGFISGEVYDATTGRPLPGASITIEVAAATPVVTAADARGRYLARLREGAHTIKASLTGYTTVWREIIVPAGAGVVPIDIRLTRRGDPKTSDGSAISQTHGGDTAVTKKVDLSLPGGGLANGRKLTFTSVGAQALTGLLPLGWSPIVSAEINVDGVDTASSLPGAQITFNVAAAEVTAAAQNLTAVEYDSTRDEWRVIAAVVNVGSDGKALVPVNSSGAFALVYPDKAQGLTPPPLPVSGDVLRGVPPAPTTAPALVKRDFSLNPPIILPTGRAVATLRIEGSGVSFPSGTAVQAYIDEELRLADGSRLLDPPFATDVLLYRTLSGDLGVADFHLAPSSRAAQVILEVGVDHIRIFPYPGRLDRGTLIGSEGGPVPADDKVAIEIPTGAVPEPLHATATSLTSTDLNAIGAIPGFRVLGGFHLTLVRATTPAPLDLDGNGQPDDVPVPELFVPARATFTVEASQLPAPTSQVILVELLDQTPYGRMVRLAAPMMRVDPTTASATAVRFTTKSIDRSLLPVDGVIHEGRYVVLAAEAPIAFATGTVHLAVATGRLLSDARVTSPSLGVAELSRPNGIYNIPVPAKPAAPFSLVPRHTSTGEGVAYTHAAQIDPDTIVRVDLALVKQPPVLGAVTVLKGDPPSQGTLSAGPVTRDVALTTNIRASFSPSIDPSSVNADSIVVSDAVTGARVSGSAAAEGSVAVVWTLTAGELLKPNARYTVAIASSIRGTNGATLAHGTTFAFATVTRIQNAEIRPERIRITIPDSNGLARIIGDAGALPAGWQAVAIRRGRDFNVRYQSTAAADGSFSFVIGNGGDPADKITIADLIDLQVVSNIGNLAGIFALTPFASEDGKSFVVPAGKAVRFTTPEGMTLDVPAGAFDVPTVISVVAAKKEDFLDIEALEAENNYATSVRVDFDGVAKKPLRLEAPVPAGLDTAGKQFILAEKGMSPLGPRLAVLDLVKVVNGKFVTDHENTDQNAVLVSHDARRGVQQTLTGSKFTKYLQMLMRSGLFMVLDIKVPGVGGSVGWAAMEGLQSSYDIIWDIYASYFIPHIHVTERGGALIPIVTGRQFTVTGIDPGTGLKAFSRTYDPIPFGDPGTVTPIPPGQQNDGGPYPVFGGPFRVEIIDLDVEEVDIRSIRNFNVRLESGSVRVTPGDPSLDADVKVELLNVSKGTMVSGSATSTMQLEAAAGNRIVLLIEQHEVDPGSLLSIVFNEPIFVGDPSDSDAVDLALKALITVAHSPGPLGSAPSFTDITPQVRFTTDSGQRRVNVELPSLLQSEALYKITLKPGISDVDAGEPGLKLGQGTIDNNGVLQPVGGGSELHLFFDVRKPAGNIASFLLPGGFVRGMELSGNLLFVAALDGGLLAYDVSNPAALDAGAAPIAKVPGPPAGALSHLSVTIDRHNRVYSTAQTGIAGNFRSYRVEDFASGLANIPIKGSKLINWKMGWSQQMGLPSNTLLSDVPESTPYRIKVILQDDETNFGNRQEFIAGTGAAKSGDYPQYDLQKFTVSVPRTSADYRLQRVTIENLSLDMRWSADAGDGPAVLSNVVARSTDRLRLIRNNRTYAVVAHLGYGIAVYDANAIESNRYANLFANGPNHMREQLVLTAGKIDRQCPNETPDHGIIEGWLPLDAELRGDKSGDIYSFSGDTFRGILDLRLQLPSPTSPGTRDDDCNQRPTPNEGGLLFQTAPAGLEVPRMQALKSAFSAAAGRAPFGHFGQLARFQWSVTAEQNRLGLRGTDAETAARREYLLVAGSEYGLIVVDIDHDPQTALKFPLGDEHVADVIWVPGGVMGVRVYQSANIALVSDRQGRVVVIDLSRIDERWDEKGQLTSGLFPTAKKALQGGSNQPYGVGADDPRILWKSEPYVAGGSVAPVFDPYTGMLFSGVGNSVKVLAALDPRVDMKVNLGATEGLSNVGGIVPLGIAPPLDIQNRIDALPACDGTTLACKENASLGVFRLEVGLPGNMVDSLVASNGELQLAIESERVAGAITEQTPNGFPRSHLRRTLRNGSPEASGRSASNFRFTRIVPEELRTALKTQRGYNRFVSPWIVAIADPRASEQYDWAAATKQQKKDAGCEECERPKHLQGKTEADGIYELYTNGRFITVRPEFKSSTGTIFENTDYSYLGRDNRLLGRFSTIMADTVRPTEVLVAGQSPAIGTGMLQETLFLHSGELQSTRVDLNTGGRAGVDVLFGRTYRSRTIGGGAFGQGWDSPTFLRLRALPNGDVEYRDGGEIWRFGANGGSEGYESPKGLFLKLTRTSRGWKLIDQKWRVIEFDDLGRVLSETDEFYNPELSGSGNVIRYLYDETGHLNQVLDPVKRASTLTYWKESEAGSEGAYPGLVKQVVDWREREIDYRYDASSGTLVKVELPDVPNASGGRPAVVYAYTPAGGDYSSKLELRPNLLSITEPHEAATGGPARVQFAYGTGGAIRDHVISQQWGTGETASFTYSSPTEVITHDVLGQARAYTLTAQPKDYSSDRSHILTMVESGVATSSTPFGQLPATITAGVPATSSVDRNFVFGYDGEGLVKSSTLNGVRSTTYGYQSVQPQAPGFVLGSTTATAQGGPSASITESIAYQTGANASTFAKSFSANGATVNAPEAHRNNRTVQASNDSINTTENFDPAGLLTDLLSSGGTDGTGSGAQARIKYAPANDPSLFQRSQPVEVDHGGGLKTQIQFASRDQIVETDPRGVVTTTDFDAWRRRIRVSVAGPGLTFDDRFQYDATGRLVAHIRKQGDKDITTRYTYDSIGRAKAVTVDNAGDGGVVTTSSVYELSSRKITMNHPGGASTSVVLDGLGGRASTVTTTGGSPITDYFAYDLDRNLVFASDLQTAAAWAYDSHRHLVGEMASDGSKTNLSLDGWGRPQSLQSVDAAGTSTGQSTFDYAPAGMLRSIATKVDSSRTRTTQFAWDGGARTTGASASGRTARSRFDVAGRLLSAESGEGSVNAVATKFEDTTVSGHDGALPQQLQTREKTGDSYQMSVEYNAAADVTADRVGNLEWTNELDQAGNVTSASVPNRPAQTFDYDSRGLLKEQELPGGGSHSFGYHPSGGQTGYTDPSSETTQTVTDLLGRPVTRIYKDGSRETIVWEGRRVKSFTDRQQRVQSFTYNPKGQITETNGSAASPLEKTEYDDAGRIVRRSTDDAVIEYFDFDFDGNPRRTAQSRYRGGVLIDRYTQEHTWNFHRERTSWTMPTYPGFASDKPWTVSVTQGHDVAGNVIRIERALAGSTGSSLLLAADYRGAGHPNERIVTTTAGTQIVREYGYNATNGLLSRMSATSVGSTVAGSVVEFDGVQKKRAQLLGLSGGARADEWTYDDRSRLKSSAHARDAGTTPQQENLTAADFRTAFTRSATTPVDPPSIFFTEHPAGGHKIDTVRRGLLVEQLTFNGGERSQDGKFTYVYDDKGRVVVVTQRRPDVSAGPLRRIRYTYAATNRIVGRIAEYSIVPNEWKTEDRPDLVTADALPAESTFVWDPISDTLMAIFKAGASQNPGIDENGGLVRQIIGGGLGYDDPIEVAVAEPASGVKRLYPVFDEAGAGLLQVILNENGRIVSRSAVGGPYGEDPAILLGPAIDQVLFKGRKAADGSVIDLNITLRTTEKVVQATVASGARLATVDSTGAIVRTSNATATLEGESTVRWTLSGAEWSTLVDPTPVTVAGMTLTPTALSVAATSTLRAAAWESNVPILRAPAWAVATKPVHASAALPVEVRESLANLSQWLASMSADEEETKTVYDVPTLLALGVAPGASATTDPQRLLVSSSFQALPFAEPVTDLIYARSRWYDPSTGSFLSPDPMGYEDSSNLYTFGGGDPVNQRDPTGQSVIGKIIKKIGRPATRALVKRAIKHQVKKTVYRKIQMRVRRKGLGKLFQVHHIVGQEFARYGTWFKKIGFEIDETKNFLILPNKAGSKTTLHASGRAIHQGPHVGEYLKRVEQRIQDVMRREASGEISPQAALKDLRQFQDELREGLTNGTIALSRAQQDALTKGGSIVLAGIGMTLVGAEAVQAAEEQELDEVAGQMADQYLERERQKNAYVKYGTATQYTGNEGFLGWVGFAIDFFNPVADVIDITDLIEDLYDWMAGVDVGELVPAEPDCPGCE